MDRRTRKLTLAVLALSAAAPWLGGCSSNDDGVDHDAVAKAQAPLVAAAKKSGGDWSKLSPDEQKLFLDRAQGNESSAKMILGMMARGPKIGGPSKR